MVMALVIPIAAELACSSKRWWFPDLNICWNKYSGSDILAAQYLDTIWLYYYFIFLEQASFLCELVEKISGVELTVKHLTTINQKLSNLKNLLLKQQHEFLFPFRLFINNHQRQIVFWFFKMKKTPVVCK